MTTSVVVWGNCQAQALADILAVSLPADRFRVERVPPVYLVTPDGLPRVHAAVARSDVLVAQPVGDGYGLAGLSTAAIRSLLPPHARVVTFPVAYALGPFPFQARGYDRRGSRVDAPVTDYHDLRAVVAARRGYSTAAALRWWPSADVDTVRLVHERSQEELRRREAELTLPVSPLLGAPDAMWTMTHPANATLLQVARAVLDLLGIDALARAPGHECLGERQAPVDASVATAHGWPSSTRRDRWTVAGHEIEPARLLDEQLAFYGHRPDVVAATCERHAGRLDLLGLS